MKFALLCKRHYTNRDLLKDRFGRLFHLPEQLGLLGRKGLVVAADYRTSREENLSLPAVSFCALPFSFIRPINFIYHSYQRFTSFNPDLLIASGDSHFGFLGWTIARRLGIPFVFDIYDDYTAFGTNKIPGIRGLFYHSVRRADLIITASISLQQRLSVINPRGIVVENGTDTDLFKAVPRNEARTALGLPLDEVVLGYFGSIDRNHGVEMLLEATRRLQQEVPKVRLLIAGRNTLGLDFSAPGVDYRGLLPQPQIPLLINACNVVVIPNLPDRQWNVSNACKIAEYLACRVPVVASDIADHAAIFAQAAQGIYQPDDLADMLRALKAQLFFPQRLPFPDALTWKNLASRLDRALQDVLATTRP